MKNTITTAAIAAMVLTATAALAAPTAADKCEASKNKTAGAYYSCREKAEATAISKGLMAPDYSKCTAKFDDKWDGAETKGETMCPDSVLTAPMNAFIAAQAAQTASIVAGSINIPTCGDGVVNAVGEVCDGVDLNGYSCVSLGQSLGNLACNGSCDFDVSGCVKCPPGTEGIDGSCWLLGAEYGVGDYSCDAACASVGLACNEPALQSVGSGGTDEDCRVIVDAIDAGSAPHPISPGSPEDFEPCGTPEDWAAGCFLFVEPGPNDGAIRALHAGGSTKCSADYTPGGGCQPIGSQRRACACN